MKKSSFVFEYSDDTLELFEDVDGWSRPNLDKALTGVYYLGTPDIQFSKSAYIALGPGEDYCLVPVCEERFHQLKLEALLNE